MWDIIGRSVVVDQEEDTGHTGTGVTWGIVARAAGVGQNTKKVRARPLLCVPVCACVCASAVVQGLGL